MMWVLTVAGIGFRVIIVNIFIKSQYIFMKKIASFLILLSVLTLGGNKSFGQIIVRVRPARPAVVINRPPAPSPRHVWVDEDWQLSGGRYVWHGGYWTAPPRPGAFYVRGHWRNTRRGSIWVPGHWR